MRDPAHSANRSSCPVCGHPRPRPWRRGGRRLLRCRACGLLYREQRVALETTTAFYGAGGENPTEAINRAKQELYEQMLATAEARLGGPGRLLDVGAGQGAFLAVARARGWQAQGIEPVAELVAEARRQGLAVEQGTLAELPAQSGPFDLICWWDVLVLVSDPPGELRAGVNLLASGGLLYGRVRQHRVVRGMELLWRGFGRLFGLANPTVYHPWNYEPRSLRALLRRVGLKGRVVCSRLTAGDAYGLARRPGRVVRIKGLVDGLARWLERVSGGRLLLSPSIELWAWRDGD